MVTVFHYSPVNAKQFDGLNIDGLARKHQKCQNFPPSKFCAIWYFKSDPMLKISIIRQSKVIYYYYLTSDKHV